MRSALAATASCLIHALQGTKEWRPRHIDDRLVVRLDRTDSRPGSPHRAKLKKRNTGKAKEEADAKKSGAAGPGSERAVGVRGRGGVRVFGRRVSDAQGAIAVEEKAGLGDEKATAEPQPDGVRPRMGGAGLGLGQDAHQRSALVDPKERRRASELRRALKRVRFMPSVELVSPASIASFARPGSVFRKLATSGNLNANGSQSKFYEAFSSKATSAAS